MNDRHDARLNDAQLSTLRSAFHEGAHEASAALATWINKPSIVEIASLDQLPLAEATGVLGTEEETLCFCTAKIEGPLAGEMILAFGEEHGFRLVDAVLDQPAGTAGDWTELTTSAVMETTNIVCCAYLNSLSEWLSGSDSVALVPSPPTFGRDFAAVLIEAALLGQAIEYDLVVLARTRFEIEGTPADWSLLFVPDADSMRVLGDRLGQCDVEREEGGGC